MLHTLNSVVYIVVRLRFESKWVKR